MAGAEHVPELASANTAFALNLYRQVCGSQDSNVFLSPFSISTALAMTFVGARETTAQQMAAVLQWPAQLPVAQAFHQYLDGLQSNTGGPKCQLLTANRIYLNAGSHFLPQFLDTTKQHFQAENTVANFSEDPEGERLKINKWVEEVTRQKIKDLIAAGVLTPLTRVVLVNAIYFKGNWATPFKAERTSKGKFRLGNGQEKECHMMHLTKKFHFGFNEQLQFSLVELPYSGNSLSMVILLPQKEDGLPELEKSLTSELLTTALRQTRSVEVNLQLPKFKMESSFTLNDALSALGMKDLFVEDKADLSGVNGDRDLYVSHVLHKAFVEVNEEGTEAAAATAAVMMTRCMPIREDFIADHPFLFFIQDVKSEMVLFMGRLMVPQ